MLVKQKSTGRYLTLRGGFRKPLSSSEACARFNDPKYCGLVCTTKESLPEVCRRFRLDPAKLELMPFDTDAF